MKQKRFSNDDTLPPGPGHYVAPDSCVVKDKGRELASYVSDEQRKLFKIQKDIPGVGSYNLAELKSVSHREMSGGAPNNFTVLNK